VKVAAKDKKPILATIDRITLKITVTNADIT
jgi:hypothetical protein